MELEVLHAELVCKIQELTSREANYKQIIAAQRARNETLKAALQVFLDKEEPDICLTYDGTSLTHNGTSTHETIGAPQTRIDGIEKEASAVGNSISCDGGISDQNALAAHPSEEDDSDDDDDDLPSGRWDESDNIYRCSYTGCTAELIEGVCHRCHTEHKWDPDEWSYHHPESTALDNEALQDDRCLAHRGTTPLLDISIQAIPIPDEYRTRKEEYHSLLERGASESMCDKYHLESTLETGIVAWADEFIYDNFAGPAMQEGDFWKIHLGRRIDLEEDDDDGAHFLEALLENALLFPLRGEHDRKWVTYEESPGIWVTRPDFEESEDEGDQNEVIAEDVQLPEDTEYHRRYDSALEAPPPPEENPAIQRNEYESDHEADGDSEDQAGCTFQAGVLDAIYRPDRDNDADEIYDEVDDDIASSDFHSDEVLSGDEGLGWREEWDTLMKPSQSSLVFYP